MLVKTAAVALDPGVAVCNVRAVSRSRTSKKHPDSLSLGVREENFPECGQDSSRFVKVLGAGGLLPVSGTSLERVAAIADRQRGRVSRGQLLAAGITSSAIGRMIGQGLLRREHAGVYAVVLTAAAPLARETAALLACGARAMLSHTSAAALWKLIPYADAPVEVTVACLGTRRTRPGIKLHRSGKLLRHDVQVKDGLPVTSPAWTLLDLAARFDTRALERIVDEALVVLKILRPDQLIDVLQRSNGRPGTPALKGLLERRTSSVVTHSQAERRCLELIREAGLPEPLTQVRIGEFTVDLLWPEHRVVFEIDGYSFHTSRSAFDRDRAKDAALKAAGYDPNRLSRDQVMFQPYLALAAIATAIARAAERIPSARLID
jgi:very-short-patch-repair endonuclease